MYIHQGVAFLHSMHDWFLEDRIPFLFPSIPSRLHPLPPSLQCLLPSSQIVVESLRVKFLFLSNKTKWVNYTWNEYGIEFVPRNWIEERVRWFVDKWEWSEASGVTPRDGGTGDGELNQESGWMSFLFSFLPIFDSFFPLFWLFVWSLSYFLSIPSSLALTLSFSP